MGGGGGGGGSTLAGSGGGGGGGVGSGGFAFGVSFTAWLGGAALASGGLQILGVAVALRQARQPVLGDDRDLDRLGLDGLNGFDLLEPDQGPGEQAAMQQSEMAG